MEELTPRSRQAEEQDDVDKSYDKESEYFNISSDGQRTNLKKTSSKDFRQNIQKINEQIVKRDNLLKHS